MAASPSGAGCRVAVCIEETIPRGADLSPASTNPCHALLLPGLFACFASASLVIQRKKNEKDLESHRNIQNVRFSSWNCMANELKAGKVRAVSLPE